MRDLFEEESLRLRGVQEGLREGLSLHGFRVVDTPALEPTDIFLRKSGGELASRLYTLTEPGGHRVSLRPEFTSAIIRLFIEQAGHEPVPVRWQYAGPVFRYAGEGCADDRQFTQVGAELIGAHGAHTDADVIALACSCLGNVGVRALRLTVGSVGAAQALLRQFQVSERTVLFLLRAMGDLSVDGDRIEVVREQAARLGLFQSADPGAEAGRLASYLAGRESDGRQTPAEPEPGAFYGVRSPEEIMDRLQRKLRDVDNPERVGQALGFAHELAGLRGRPGDTLDAARDLVARHGLDPSPLTDVQDAIAALGLHDLGGVELALDLGLVRDIAYYTGLVFEVHENAEAGRFLAGGGRYDGLVRALGGERDTPALGFAYTLESVAEAAARQNPAAPPPHRPTRVLVVPRTAGGLRHAIRVAAAARAGGESAEVAYAPGESGEAARDRGIDAVVTVEDDGSVERHQL